MKEFILEKRNTVSVNSVGKALGFMGSYNYIRSLMYYADPMK